MQTWLKRILAAGIVSGLLTASAGAAPMSLQDTTQKYEDYISKVQAEYPQAELVITADQFDSETSEGCAIETETDGTKTVLSREEGKAVFRFEVSQAGYYNIAVRYMAVKGKDIGIQRAIAINGEIPFKDFNEYEFSRIWTDGEIISDKNGNQYVPEQVEVFEYREEILHSGERDDDAFRVYLKQGTNTITFASVKEAMKIEKIRLFQTKLPVTYDQYYAKMEKEHGTEQGEAVTLEAEKASRKSDNTLYPINDKTSALTTPNSVNQQLINAIGGNNWGTVKQSITWEVPVEKSGFYKLNLRLKQDYAEGSNAYRRLYVDGTVPFYEALSIEVPYQTGFQNLTLGEEKPMLLWLEAGTREITLETVYGETYPIFKEVNQVIVSLNELYRKIIMITSTSPDENRDYGLEKAIPDLLETLKDASAKLKTAGNQLEKLTGAKGNNYSLIHALEIQIDGYIEKPYLISSSLSTFNTNISALSSAVLTQIKQPVLIDKMSLLPANQQPEKADAGFFGALWYEIKSLIASFFNDYTMINESDSAQKPVTIWLTTGRDQSNSMKQLIDNDFSKNKGIAVNLRLVAADALLPAVAVGGGPDVAITQERTMPLNYGFRGAVYDLANFSDCKEVLAQFPEAASMPFTYGEYVYGIPDSFTFYMMFYRKDILQELELKVPTTWDEVNTLLPVLGNRYLSLGLPNISTPNANAINNDIYFTLLYQRGAEAYDSGHKFADLSTDEAVTAFEQWTDFYTKYSVPKEIDMFTRFRTGETPIVIAPYTFYNQLVIAAPEIESMWDFTNVPGTVRKDGSVDHSVAATGTATVLFTNSQNKENAWEFIKWWTSPDAQQKYNQRLEILMGPSARVAVASKEALGKLPWTKSEYEKLSAQMDFAKGVPEVPGGYMTQRYLNTAALLTINNAATPRSTITSYNRMINDEIRLKREEFGLDQ